MDGDPRFGLRCVQLLKETQRDAGVVKCPMTWVYWTSPEKVAIIDHITIYLMESNGWVMFNGDMTNDP